VHKQVRDFIRQQVDDGVLSVAEMKRHTEAYVRNFLFCGKRLPSKLNRRYYPVTRDYANLIYRRRMEKTHSVIDEENLLAKMNSWKTRESGDRFYFRPCSGENNKSRSTNAFDEQDEDTDITLSTDQSGLLLIHQTAWQMQLLAKYGSVCLLDATYKTTKYAVPLFFLCVKTNVDYCVVGTFVTQYEDSSSIAEALQMINQWNPNWQPESFVVDYCEAEIGALEDVFPRMLIHDITGESLASLASNCSSNSCTQEA